MTPLENLDPALHRIRAGADAIADSAGTMGPTGGRRLGKRLGLSGLVALALVLAARFALEATPLETWQRIAIALVPLPAFAWFVWEFIRTASDADELERRVQLEALAVAFPLTLLLVMTLGLLQIAVPLPPDDWSYRHIWPLLYVFYLVGLTRARRRYA
jgi:cobalamin synthase